MPLTKIEDAAHWFTQEEVDRFHASMARTHRGSGYLPQGGALYGLIAELGGAPNNTSSG